MNILYIIRKRENRHWSKRLQRWVTGFTDGQDGFFEASLHSAAKVTRRSYAEALAMGRGAMARYDAIVINGKSGLPWRDAEETARVVHGWGRPAALFLGSARPQDMAPDAVCDMFDVLFKREPYADLDRYDLSATNKAKLVTTLLSNQLVNMSWRFPSRNQSFVPPAYGWDSAKSVDVFFLGKVSHVRLDNRVAAWTAVRAELGDLNCIGGLSPNDASPVPEHLRGEIMPKPDYLKTLLATRVNLALSGIGPFTHRHLELFWAGAFALSNNDIAPLWLRAPVVKGRDYAAFDTEDEMIDMIRHYVSHDHDRDTIARNGRAAFERLYDVPAHGQELRAALQKVIR